LKKWIPFLFSFLVVSVTASLSFLDADNLGTKLWIVGLSLAFLVNYLGLPVFFGLSVAMSTSFIFLGLWIRSFEGILFILLGEGLILVYYMLNQVQRSESKKTVPVGLLFIGFLLFLSFYLVKESPEISNYLFFSYFLLKSIFFPIRIEEDDSDLAVQRAYEFVFLCSTLASLYIINPEPIDITSSVMLFLCLVFSTIYYRNQSLILFGWLTLTSINPAILPLGGCLILLSSLGKLSHWISCVLIVLGSCLYFQGVNDWPQITIIGFVCLLIARACVSADEEIDPSKMEVIGILCALVGLGYFVYSDQSFVVETLSNFDFRFLTYPFVFGLAILISSKLRDFYLTKDLSRLWFGLGSVSNWRQGPVGKVILKRTSSSSSFALRQYEQYDILTWLLFSTALLWGLLTLLR